LPLHVRLTRDVTFRGLIALARQTALEGFAHQELPFNRLLESLDPPRDRTRSPLFQAMLNMLPPGPSSALETDGIRLTLGGSSADDAPVDTQAQFDVTLYAHDDRELGLGLVYDRDLFADERMRTILADVVQMLVAGSAEPDAQLERLFATQPVSKVATVAAPVEAAGPMQMRESVPARAALSPSEALIADVWMSLLGIDSVRTDDIFFEIGGHSLLAVRASVLIEKRTGSRIPPRSMFFRTLAELAESLPVDS
jgi:non-ribosomal peptide synthetase component F